MLRRRRAGQDRGYGWQELVGHRAADAAVGKLDHILLSASRNPAAADYRSINAEIAELVDQKRQPTAAAMLQQVPDQAGLAGAQKARDNGSGDFQGHADLLVGNDASVG